MYIYKVFTLIKVPMYKHYDQINVSWLLTPDSWTPLIIWLPQCQWSDTDDANKHGSHYGHGLKQFINLNKDLKMTPSFFKVIWSMKIYFAYILCKILTHWGRVTHICIIELTTIGSDNGLSPGRRQAIIWTNTGMLFIGILGTNFSGIFSEINTFSFKKMHFKTSSAKWRPFCLGLKVLNPESHASMKYWK